MAKAGRPGRENAAQENKARDRQRQRTPQPAPESAAAAAPSEQELVAAAIGAAVQAVGDGRRDPHGAHLDPLAIERTPGWTEAVSRAVVGFLRASVTTAWARGWQPAELARHFGRELSAQHAAMVADMITAEMLGFPAATVDPRWAAQAAALEAAAPGPGTWWGSDANYLRARYALGHDAEFIVTVATAVETLHGFQRLPAVERLLPLPGTVRPSPAPASGAAGSTAADPAPARAGADERMLSRIRALLAKAESTEFGQEAEALSGRAQELMAKYSIDHALLAAEAGRPESPGGRRIAVDHPYEAPKATLLQIVAQANRCRVVWSRELGLVTVIGFPADLDAVELLFTSLLVQASTAMLRPGGDGGGRPRTKAFRQSFLLAYAVRIGERLEQAADQAERAAVAEQRAAAGGPDGGATEGNSAGGVAARQGADLVPFLAARHQAVDDAVEEMFGSALTRSRSVRATDVDGWNSGRAAADLASLRHRAEVDR